MASRQKILVALILPVVVGLLPGFVLDSLGLDGVSGDAAIAIMAGLIAAIYAGPRTGLLLAAATGVAAAVSIPAATSPLLAGVLMVATAAGMGVAARMGSNSAVAMGPVTVAFLLSEPPPSTSAWVVGVVIAVCVAYGTLLGYLVRKRIKAPVLEAISTSRAAAYAAVLALLLGVGGWVVVDKGLGHAGAWMLMTMLIVVQPYLQDGWNRSLQRALGTVAGFVVAIAVAVVLPYPFAIYAVATVAFVLAIHDRLDGAAYWRYVSLLTVGIVLVEGASTSVVATAEQRLFATLAGVAAALLAMAAMGPFYRRGAHRAGLDRY